MNTFPEILSDKNISERHVDFRKALFDLKPEHIQPEHIGILTGIYLATKQIDYRNKILKLLYDFDHPELRSFFETAYKKERYLDMKIHALRGLAKFSEEKDIAKLISKLKIILAKREETTPYNYQEYELLRGKNALPYLVGKYDYSCFKDILCQVNEQYERMPDAFKGHITTDESGETVQLRSPAESSAMIRSFFDSLKEKM
ncbi:MAG: hypothetical protein LBE92_03795 [Chryseobacterium sp.]|jgi:hypothetical protein|uniref:hypothetical protein n=1 Tax=Chryseobacterium sp. TaxID=1871047 RepID=UPI002832FA3A|nr:hypothetical protein [Chryseobacterium sp.]MDR2235224.1 hypothetical protein [Chryseobacterium sp.]